MASPPATRTLQDITYKLTREALQVSHGSVTQTNLLVQDMQNIRLREPDAGCPPGTSLEISMESHTLTSAVIAVDQLDREELARNIVREADSAGYLPEEEGSDVPRATHIERLVEDVRVAVEQTLGEMITQTVQNKQTIRHVRVTACDTVINSTSVVEMVAVTVGEAAAAALAPKPPKQKAPPAPPPDRTAPPPPAPAAASTKPKGVTPQDASWIFLGVMLATVVAMFLVWGVARWRRGRPTGAAAGVGGAP